MQPVFYFKIDSDFVPDLTAGVYTTEYNWETGESTNIPLEAFYVPAGTGTGYSGSRDYGYLVVNYLKTDVRYSMMGEVDGSISFVLFTNYDAKVRQDTVPVTEVWCDLPYDRSENVDYNTLDQVIERGYYFYLYTGNTTDNAPYGVQFRNDQNSEAPAKTTDDTKTVATMIMKTLSTTKTITAFNATGLRTIATATRPYQYSQKVYSHDIMAADSDALFGADIIFSGPENSDTSDWVAYVEVPKQGNTNTDPNGGDSYTNAYSLDLVGLDASELDSVVPEGADGYTIWYTTVANPSTNGITHDENDVPAEDTSKYYQWDGTNTADLRNATMIKIMIPRFIKKGYAVVHMSFVLHDRKAEVGEQETTLSTKVNYKYVNNSNSLWFSNAGGTTNALHYVLEDMTLTGYAWHETDYDSIYDGTDTLYDGLAVSLVDPAGKVIAQGDGYTANVTNANGEFTLLMPHDGVWEVKIVSLPAGEQLVTQYAATGVTAAEHTDDESWFHRQNLNTGTFTFTSDYTKTDGFTMSGVAAGLATIRPFNIPTVSEHTGTTSTVTIAAEKPGNWPDTINDVSIWNDPEDATVATLTGNDDKTAKVTTVNSGTTTASATLPDGYFNADGSEGIITKTFTIISCTNVIYDTNEDYNANGKKPTADTLGTAPADSTNYYPSTSEDGTAAKTDEVTVAGSGTLTRVGYTLTGWSTTPDPTDPDAVIYGKGDTFATGTLIPDTTLYAVWTPITYTVTFHENGEDVNGTDLSGVPTSASGMNGSTQSFDYDAAAANLTKSDLDLTGYDFTGWNTKSDGSGTDYADEAAIHNDTTTANGNIDLYAQWNPHEYDITYDNNAAYNKDMSGNDLAAADGKLLSGTGTEFTGSTADTHHVWGTPGNIATDGYALDGYYFVSWNTQADGTGTSYVNNQQVKNLTSENGGKITLYAQWAIITSASSTPVVTKEITGGTPQNEQDFVFVITADTAEAPMPENDTVTITGAGEASIGSMIFNREGVYKYTISETAEDNPDYIYDTDAVTMTITVTENDKHQLVAEASYLKAGNDAEKLLFTNVYKRPNDAVSPADPAGPNTGDTSNLLLWTALLSLACTGLITVIVIARKKKNLNAAA